MNPVTCKRRRRPSRPAAANAAREAQSPDASGKRSGPVERRTHSPAGGAVADDMRIRQSCAAVILDGIHGRLDAQPSNLRALRAYWVLVGMIYTRLAEKDSPIKTG